MHMYTMATCGCDLVTPAQVADSGTAWPQACQVHAQRTCIEGLTYPAPAAVPAQKPPSSPGADHSRLRAQCPEQRPDPCP